MVKINVKKKVRVAMRPKQSKRASRASQSVRGPSGFYLDGAALAHAKLLADPCQGKIVPAAYPNPGGGCLQRFRSIFTVGTGAGETCGLVHWVPGTNEYYANGAATATTSYLPTSGTVFQGLAGVAGTGCSLTTFRCVAACLKVIPNASEMNRSGICYAGQTTGDFYGNNLGSTTTIQGSVASLPVSTRVPAKSLDVLWTPSASDQQFGADILTVTSPPGQGPSWNAMTVGAIGMPAASGLTVEFTAVYEINYNSNGIVNSTPVPSTTTPWNNTLIAFNRLINNAPVIIDTVRAGVEHFTAAANSQPGRAITGAVLHALAL